MKINFLVILTALNFLFSNLTHASDLTDLNWKKQLASNQLDYNNQSYCYTNTKGEIQGINIDNKIRLASVSKLIVSLWSIDSLGSGFKFKTKLYIKNSHLHIAGSSDPFLGEEKMFFLLSQLNELGYNHFDTISFDSHFLVNPSNETAHSEFPDLNPSVIAKLTKDYFNTKRWDLEKKTAYVWTATNDKNNRFKKTVDFSVDDVTFEDKNPFELEENVRELTLSSPELYRYLKQMNIDSNNYVAENIFRQLGGATNFEKYMNEKYSLDQDKIHFYTGSGLPFFDNNVRFDNYSTCSVMMDLISSLKKEIENQSKTLEDIVAVPGSDAGTFRNRTFPAEFKNAFVAKTGTLVHTSTLAGALSTINGISFFGIFNQTSEIKNAKRVQNSMVASIMNDLGGPKSFDYTVEEFHSYNEENVKKFPFIFSNDNEFSSLGENLY